MPNEVHSFFRRFDDVQWERADFISDDGLARGYDIYTPALLDRDGYLHAHEDALNNLQGMLCKCCVCCYRAICNEPSDQRMCVEHDPGDWGEGVEYE